MSRRNAPLDPDAVTEQLRRSLQILGLTYTLQKLDDHLAAAARDKPSAGVLLERVLGEEAAHKLEHRIERRIAHSGLPERKTLEAFEWAFQPDLDKALVLELARLDFVRRHDDLLITGAAGTGKSHILKALTLRACQAQMRVRYGRGVDLLNELYAGLADGTYLARLRAMAAVDLLIIDDVGLGQLKKRDDEPTAAHTLYDLIDRRHTRLSTAVSSNIALSQWGDYLGDHTLAAAILDRLAMHAVRIHIDGPSYRQHQAAQRNSTRGRKAPADTGAPTHV